MASSWYIRRIVLTEKQMSKLWYIRVHVMPVHMRNISFQHVLIEKFLQHANSSNGYYILSRYSPILTETVVTFTFTIVPILKQYIPQKSHPSTNLTHISHPFATINYENQPSKTRTRILSHLL